MHKNSLKKYSLILITLLILFSLFNFFIKKRKLAAIHNEVLKIEFRPLIINKNCFFKIKAGLSFILNDCEKLEIGETYTIIGRANTVIDNKINWQKNFDVSSFYQNSDVGCSVFNYIWRLFAYYERKVAKLQTNFLNFLQSNFSRDKYQLVTALILGTKVFDFDHELKSEFANIGLSHMIAVSGFHLGVVAGVFDQCLGKIMSKKKRRWLLLPGLWFYVALVGSSLSVLRACFMLSISFIGRNFFYKQTSSLLVLFLAFILMFNNAILNVFDVGFLLSYLATLGILLLAGEIGQFFIGEKMIKWSDLSEKELIKSLKNGLFSLGKYLKEMIIVSISAQILTLPVTVTAFQEYAWWSVLSTIIFSTLIVLVVTMSVYLLLTFSLGYYLSIFQIFIVEPFTFYLNIIVNLFLIIFGFYTSYFSKIVVFTWQPSKFLVMGYYIFWFLFVFLIKKSTIKRNIYVQ